MIPAVKINSLIEQSDPMWSPLHSRRGKLLKSQMILGNKLLRPTFGIRSKHAVKKIKSRTRRPYCIDIASEHLRDFMTSSSMHGLKYAAEKEASWIER